MVTVTSLRTVVILKLSYKLRYRSRAYGRLFVLVLEGGLLQHENPPSYPVLLVPSAPRTKCYSYLGLFVPGSGTSLVRRVYLTICTQARPPLLLAGQSPAANSAIASVMRRTPVSRRRTCSICYSGHVRGPAMKANLLKPSPKLVRAERTSRQTARD